MALFINVDPVPARWYKRPVYRGWQFGYSGGTQNDFMMDVEVARWRFVCYIGFKFPRNPSPRQERHEVWRKEQERARERANRPESAFKRFWRKVRRTQTPADRVDQKRSQDYQAPAASGLLLAAKRFLRFGHAPHDDHDQRRRQLAARPGLPKPISGNAAASIEGQLLRQVDQRPASEDDHHQDPEGRGLPKEPNA